MSDEPEAIPVLYHYAAIRQHPDGNLEYFHGSSERHPSLATNADYNDFVDRLATSLGVPAKGLIILSLNRL